VARLFAMMSKTQENFPVGQLQENNYTTDFFLVLWFMDKDKFELAGFILETEGPS
jgi:hypothetical protein